MNSITKFAVKYPVSVLMLTLAVCLLGTISYNKLGTDLFPDLKNPALYVRRDQFFNLFGWSLTAFHFHVKSGIFQVREKICP